MSDCIVAVNDVLLKLIDPDKHPLTQQFAEEFKPPPASFDLQCCVLSLKAEADGLHLLWAQAQTKKRASAPLDLHIDLQQLTSQRSFPAAKQGAFNQALGKKTKTVIDATGGWGGDALLMCSQGYQVHVIERNPIMAVLLNDAMQRLSRTDWARANHVHIPTVSLGEAEAQLAKLATRASADCVYLDPMFPPKRKKSAAVNKKMAVLHHLVGEDVDAADVLQAAVESGVPRIAVKRPDYAEPLQAAAYKQSPAVQFSSKLVHYDVYFA